MIDAWGILKVFKLPIELGQFLIKNIDGLTDNIAFLLVIFY